MCSPLDETWKTFKGQGRASRPQHNAAVAVKLTATIMFFSAADLSLFFYGAKNIQINEYTQFKLMVS
jgi:hypothetical protein